MGSEEEMNVTKKRKRSNAYADRTRDPNKPLLQPKINQELLEIDKYNLWVHWTTHTWGGKYNKTRFTRWWTTVRGWSKSDIPKGLFDKQNKRMRVRRDAPFSSDHPLSITVPNRISGCVFEATLRPNPRQARPQRQQGPSRPRPRPHRRRR
jgi:hypothetical protein